MRQAPAKVVLAAYLPNTGTLAMGGMGISATSKAITGRGTYFMKCENGKITESHTHPDAAGMTMQMGLMGAPA